MKIRLSIGRNPRDFDLKCLKLDTEAASSAGIELVSDRPDLTLWYGEPELTEDGRHAATRAAFASRSIIPWRRARPVPLISTEALTVDHPGRVFIVPEAVDPAFRGVGRPEGLIVGFVQQDETMSMIEAIQARCSRFRDDIEWRGLHTPLTPEQVGSVSLLLDPATSEADLEGGTAEGLVAGLPVIASRTRINQARALRGGRITLYPMGDANEAVHAILGHLFKPETMQSRDAARGYTLPHFDPVERASVLASVLGELL